jgi:acyl-CoA dehydrogenase
VAKQTWNGVDIAKQLVSPLAEQAGRHDEEGSFVVESYRRLQQRRAIGALVPTELGGGGANLEQICDFLRMLAHGCPSTALALSMHQHLVAAAVWKLKQQGESAPLLKRIAEEQIVLVSTGASDWVDSNGSMTRVAGGYRVTARKIFSSGCEVAEMMVTSSRYDDPQHGPQVLHFAMPYAAEGVRILDDWDTLGMRATGSHTVVLEDVFVADDAIALARAPGAWHPALTVAIASAVPIYMSPYVGIAEKGHQTARDMWRGLQAPHHMPYLLAELEGELATAKLAHQATIRCHADYGFAPTVATAGEVLTYKTICTKACIAAVHKAMEISGGRGYFRRSLLERLWRDVQAAPYHPLPEKKQQLFTGRLALGLDPISGHPL